MRLAGETVFRLPAKLAGWYCGLYEYSRHNCVDEINVGMHLMCRKEAIYHFLYGEKGFRFSGCLSGIRGNRLVASFHHAPSRFDEMVPYKRHLRYLDHAIVMASNQVEHIEQWVGQGKVSVVPHGVDVDYWQPAADRVVGERLKCVFAGLHMRDFETLEAVVKCVNQSNAPVDFVLLCSDRRCESIASLPNVTWRPRTSDEDFRYEIQSSDALVLPLNDSTAVNSVLEAMACGLAVITTAGGVSDYLRPSFSLQFQRGDSAAMAETVICLAEDRELLARMQIAAREEAQNLSWTSVARRIREVYTQFGG
ncbi:hypothetical protein C5Y97_08290 [Blastopirellula marina]|uniref:Glycosyl transferase family 1 domain-containing protein n=1 Tax=Blastopirellula marina TaxID=124 RepID=A0A2S8G0W2_9BACT|nr:hypothetical protein C5Y98_08290 [Blastopirellula marina]PTL44729.1 hypothetical protein C5Y97_08290 [Blastopirellula marina]